ncbi:YtxH domain-containing protein [Bacillus ndiopicus]|uniref:YtxH domain-containing protein n=1 Tax=Bacillus ndiopicus TaxID=1347368 RepID=UPI0005A7F9ED|nr:YtxH domain-containing protein [Bacillus ndiopicus]
MTEQKTTNLPQVYTTRNEDIYGEETVNMKDFIIGALVGGIVGAAAGLLLAPKSGRDLRGAVATQAVSLRDRSVELSSTAKEKTVQLSSQLKEQSTNLVDKVKAKTAKTPTVFDDGTVSSEGEEPLDEIISTVVEDAKQEVPTEDMSEIARPSSI